MTTLRMMRLLNSLETGSTTGTQLQTLLADTGRLGEFTNLLNLRSQTKRLASSPTAMAAVAASSTAMGVITASSTAMTAVAASSTAINTIAASSVTAASSTAMRTITTSYLSAFLGRLFPSCGGYLAGYIDTNTSTRYYYFAAPRANSGQTTSGIPWYANGINQAGLADIASYTWPGLTSTGIIDASAASGTGFNGQANTAALYAAGDTTSANAGGFAKTRSVTLGSLTFTDYFLGSAYEMDMCYRNATSFNANAGVSEQWDMTQPYWTSTEINNTNSWYVYFPNGNVTNNGTYTKTYNYFVRGLRKFTI